MLLAVVLVIVVAGPASASIDLPFTYLERDSSDGRFDVVYEDASGPTTVATRDALTAPAISPDGSRIAFSGVVGDGSLGLYAIFLVNTDGSGLTQLTLGSYSELDPAWSPDGNSIVFSRNHTGSYSKSSCCRLARVSVSTGTVTNIAGLNGAVRPAYSPTGSLIAFENPTGIYTISSSGGSSTLRGANGMDPTFSPTGSHIAYVVRSGSTSSLRVIPTVSGSVDTLYTTTRSIEAPVWEGERIYFVEHAGVGYDSRTQVSFKSISASGGSATTEKSMGTVVAAELDVSQTFLLPSYGFAAGDFNGDGRDDIVSRGFCGTPAVGCWRVQLSTGSGYTAPQDWGDGAYVSSETTIFGIIAADFNGDGRDDIVYRGFCGSQVKCWRVQPSTGSSFLYGQNWGNGAYFSSVSDDFGVVAGDFDADGRDDIAYRGFCGSQVACWRVQLSTGSGFLYGINWGNGAYLSPESDDFGVVADDFDGDGRDDIVYRGFCGSQVACWRVQ
ncbi:MAG: FG-GAP-like repeat-containing protein, partial [Acidimicrobiia bacterium]